MSVRNNARQKGEHDYSNIGVSGRRTGLVLPQGRLDINGIEEISGIFSSPRKSSPLKKVSSAHESDDDDDHDRITPKQTRSTRKAPPRSASPRKSGIGGTARRSNAVDILNQNSAKQNQIVSPRNREKAPVPVLRSDIQFSSPPSERHGARTDTLSKKNAMSKQTSDGQGTPVRRSTTRHFTASPHPTTSLDDEPLPPVDDDNEVYNDHEIRPTEPEKTSKRQQREPTTANSTRKRKSDATEPEYEREVASSPAAKRAKRISEENGQTRSRKVVAEMREDADNDRNGPSRSAIVNKKKEVASTMSAQQQEELNKMVDRIRSRPGEKKSLYILKREARDAGTVLTRSGRVSVKPLAYWRNERCVYGGSPGGATLADGARFPMNSIKEIIRIEESSAKKPKNRKKQTKQKGNTAQNNQISQDDDEAIDSSNDEDDDPDAEPWETQAGTIRGPVAVWDHEQQTAIREEEEVDIAYAAGAIETKDVKGSDFKYAKLYSSSFFGSGLVLLPPGAVKKPKNSRKMQMSFFVAEGRVSVSVGSMEGPENRFSIGKGGFWQVPRGNQYSIENEHSKPATVFFSQGCEPGPWDPDQ